MIVICWMIVGILNSPMSQSGRKSGSSWRVEIASQRLEIDTTASDQERGRGRSKSPKPSELRLFEGKVDEILRKQNVQLLLKVILTKRVMQKLDMIKTGLL